MCVFVYSVDRDGSKSIYDREPLEFHEVYIFAVSIADFRNNPRGTLGTRTSTLHKEGLRKLRDNWVYKKP